MLLTHAYPAHLDALDTIHLVGWQNALVVHCIIVVLGLLLAISHKLEATSSWASESMEKMIMREGESLRTELPETMNALPP